MLPAPLRFPLMLLGVVLGACSGPHENSARPRTAVAPIALPETTIAPSASMDVAPPVRTLPPALSDEQLAAKLTTDPASLASMSIGRPNRGALFNAIQMPESPRWHVVEPDHSWGTDESVASIVHAISTVNEAFEATPELYIGHLSSRRGGYLRPHRSHQSGRDADIGFYYTGGRGWYARATAKNLDLPRTWALVKAFANDPNVENIFVDRSIQKLLREYAAKAGENAAFIDGIFESSLHRDRIVRHEWGHLTHLHVRFRCPVAEEAGVRAGSKVIAALDAGRPARPAPSRRRKHG